MKHISQIIAEMTGGWKENAGVETSPEDPRTLSLTKKQDGSKMAISGKDEHEKNCDCNRS